MSTPTTPYFAAIDLGSNSFHMLIIRVNEDRIEIVDREKNMIQIAREINHKGELSQNGFDKAIECLEKFSERLRDIPKNHIRAVGTKTLRSISNAGTFLKHAKKTLGVSIEIIAGYEEARLVYAGLANNLPPNNESRLVIDIGGGSTELIIGTNYKPKLMESLPLGCVSFTKNFYKKGLTQKSMRHAYLAACDELEEIRQPYLKKGWMTAYGTSGTIKAIAEILKPRDGGSVISREALFDLAQKVSTESSIPDADIPKLRRDVLPAGIAILQAIFDELNLNLLHVSDASLKEGLIYDTIGRLNEHDVREDTIENLIERYNIDSSQSERIASATLTFWGSIAVPSFPDFSSKKILTWSSKLYEIGLSISHSGYHRHGYYLLRFSDLAGFSRFEQFIMAKLVRLHRKRLTPAAMTEINEDISPTFIPMLICLRVAVCLFRRREDLALLPKFKKVDNTYVLTFKASFLERNPLTKSSLINEMNYFKEINIDLRIEST